MADDFKLKGKVVLDDTGFKSGLDNLQSQGEQFSKSFTNSMFGAMTAANLASKGVELLMSTLKSAVNEFTMLDTNLAKVNTLLDQQVLSTTNLRMELLRVSSATGIYASELANASYEALSAGVETQNLTEFIEDMTTLAQGGFTSVTNAVDVTTSIMNAYGKEVYSVKEISDKLITTQNNGKVVLEELSRTLYNVIPAAAALGISLDEVLGGIAQLTMSGVPAAQATTQLRQMMLELSDSTRGAGEQLKNITGKTFAELRKEGYSLAQIIEALSRGAENANVPLIQLFTSVEAGQGALILAKGGAKEFNEQVLKIGDSANAADEAQKTATDNMKQSWKGLWTQITNDFVDDGNVFQLAGDMALTFSRNTYDFIKNTFKLLTLPQQIWKDFVEPVKKDVAEVNDIIKEGAGETAAPIEQIETPGAVITEKNKGRVKSAEQLANEAAREERRLFLEEQRNYNTQRDVLDSEFKTSQLEKDIEFFNQISEMKNQNWVDEMDLDQAYQDYQYEKFQAEQEFRLEQLQADLEFYANKKEYAADYANTLASIKELEAQSIEKALDREEQLKNRDLTFTQRVNKSKENLIKGAYSTIITTNDNMLKALSKFFLDSIGNMMMAHGAELMYTGIKDVAKGIAISANPSTAGMGAPLIAAGKNEIAQSALFAVGAGAMKAFSGATGVEGSSGDTTSIVPGVSNDVNDRIDSVSLEKEKSVTIYTEDGDMKTVLLSMLHTINDLAKDYNNITII
ncbi:MAG: phage tail tape measure protein [Cetobacterium sp.]